MSINFIQILPTIVGNIRKLVLNAKAFNDKVTNNGFFSNLVIDDDCISWLLRDAMIIVNRELSCWQAQQTAARLNDIDSQLYNDQSGLYYHYQSAVYHRAATNITEHNTATTTRPTQGITALMRWTQVFRTTAALVVMRSVPYCSKPIQRLN